METPEEILEALLRLRWPDADVPWDEVVRVSIQLGGLLRADSGKPKQKALPAPAPVVETVAEKPKRFFFQGDTKSNRIEAILRQGKPISTLALAKATGASAALALQRAKELRAEKVGREINNGIIWQLNASGHGPKPRKKMPPRQFGPEILRKMRWLLEQSPMSASAVGRELGISQHMAERYARELGAKRIGTAFATMRWVLPKKTTPIAKRKRPGTRFNAYGPEVAEKMRSILAKGPKNGLELSQQLGVSYDVVKRFARMIGASRIGDSPGHKKWVLIDETDHHKAMNGEGLGEVLAEVHEEALTHE